MTAHKFAPPFSEDGTQVADTTGKMWTTETWHKKSSVAFSSGDVLMFVNGRVVEWGIKPRCDCTHFMVRKPIAPPEPVAKSQAEIDSEAFVQWVTEAKNFEYRAFDTGQAALAWERDRVKQENHERAETNAVLGALSGLNDIAKGLNAAQLTNAQVGEGWRLAEVKEMAVLAQRWDATASAWGQEVVYMLSLVQEGETVRIRKSKP